MPIVYLSIDIFDSGARVGIDALIFDKIEKFFKYLNGLPSVKEPYRVKLSIKDHIRDDFSDKLHDREVVVKLEADEDVLEADIKKIGKYAGIKSMDKLDVRQL